MDRKIGATQLAHALGGWSAGESPATLPAQLAAAVQHAALPADTVLPPTRALAQALGVSRTTVTDAYSLLRESGWLEARQGSGSRVRGTTHHGPLTDGRLVSINGGDSGVLDLSSGALSGLPAVGEALESLTAADIEPYLATDGYWPHGIPALREAVADYYARLDLPTSPDQIVITGGSQQAIALLGQALMAPGDRVAVEDPTYRGALTSFGPQRKLPVPMTRSGLDLRVLDTATRTTPARAVYVLPTAHNPTGVTLPELARQRLAALCQRRGMMLIDDGSTAETLSAEVAAPSLLAQHLPDELSATIGTTSKIWWGGLRIGWIRAAPSLVDRIAELRRPSDLAGPVIEQVLAGVLLDNLGTHRAQRRAWLQQRYESAAATLADLAPHWTLPYGHPTGGTTMWVRVPGVNCVTLTSIARHELGIKATPGTANSATDDGHDVLRIPFAVDPHQLRDGLAELVRLSRDPRVQS